MIPEIHISDYSYNLPDERIAKFPLERRDASKLLIYREGKIDDGIFSSITDYLPHDAMMVFNETKVVPARLHFTRQTGAHVEIFCLEPDSPSEYIKNFASHNNCRWKCIVGNVKRCKEGEILSLMNPDSHPDITSLSMTASIIRRDGQTAIVEFNWSGDSDFSQVLDICGTIPIPPYLNRETQSIDLERYQTTYAVAKGSVAAPTAGLHFTKEVLSDIAAKGIDIRKVCLHVGAGTFLPVKSDKIEGHTMHREPFVVSRNFVASLSAHLSSGKPLIAVGTTSVRTLESLYWAGIQCVAGDNLKDVGQWDPYEYDGPEICASAALDALAAYMDRHSMTELSLGTRIIIVPGYRLRIVDILVTNFHQPQSTLILLISAFVKNEWRAIYDHALNNGYRFLSYGDSSLLFAVK